MTIPVTTGPIAGSKKVYLPAEGRPNLRVPFRDIELSAGAGIPVFRVYDTSGPYTDPASTIAINAGLPRLREAWIRYRRRVET